MERWVVASNIAAGRYDIMRVTVDEEGEHYYMVEVTTKGAGPFYFKLAKAIAKALNEREVNENGTSGTASEER